MEKIVKIFKEINDTSGTKAKADLLRKYESEYLFKDILKFRYSPYVTTNIAENKISKELDGNDYPDFVKIVDWKHFLYFLEYQCTGKNTDIFSVLDFIERNEESSREFLRQLATNKLIVGINASGINKVFSGLIPSFKPMLAYKVRDCMSYLEDKIVYVTLKLDGNRCFLRKEDGVITTCSRTGRRIRGLVDIEKYASDLEDGYVYDGELVIADRYGKGLNDCASVCQKTGKIVRGKSDIKDDLELHIFDALSVEEFDNNISTKTYKERREFLESIKTNKYIHISKLLYVGVFNDSVLDIFYDQIAKGEEGLMVNTADGLYQGKRTKDILKLKEFYNVDLKMTEVIEGTGRARGRAEAIMVEYKGEIIKAGMGKGVKQEDKEDLFVNANDYIGKIVMVSHYGESENQHGGKSLRYPKFVLLRLDKDDVSYD